MIKINLKEMSLDYLKVLKSVFDVEHDEILKFEDWDDLTHQSEVVGYYNAFQIILNYGLENAQCIADEYGIEKPLANIEKVASAIVEKILRDSAEEV